MIIALLNLKIPANFSMKKIIVLLIVLYASVSQAQDKRSNVDYQYVRTETDYHAYSAFVKSNAPIKNIEIELVSTFGLDKLETISIKKGKHFIKISFAAINSVMQNDNKSLNGLSILPSFDKIWKANINCETTIVFQFENGKKIELPFMFCRLKEQINAN